LNRVEDVLDVNSELFSLGSVDVGEQLRRVNLEAGKDPGEFGGLGGFSQHLIHRGVERGVS
jgi:hypothetical protein